MVRKTQIITDIDNLPLRPLQLENEDGSIVASMSSDLKEASGRKLLVKKAIKEYVDKTITNNRELLDNYTYSVSDVVSSQTEIVDNYQLSYKPNFIEIENGNVIIRLSEVGLKVYNEKQVKNINSADIVLDNQKIISILNTLDTDYDGCMISDSRCDGSENTKFFNTIKVDDISYNIESVNGIYRYFLTANNEIIYGMFDIESEQIMDIVRGSCISEHFSILPLQTLQNESKIYLLNSIRIYYDFETESIVLIPTEKVQYKPELGSSEGSNNDCFYSTNEEIWHVFNRGIWSANNGYVYLGDLIYRSTTLLGVYNSDIKWILDNVSNIEIKVSGNKAYTNSDYTYISVFDKIVEFNLDRLRWDLSEYNSEVYLYVDGDGKTWIDTLKPRYNNVLEYYVHYYHYWRCVGHLKLENNVWAIKEI